MSMILFYSGLTIIFILCLIAGTTLAIAMYLLVKGVFNGAD